ncbi:Fur family transcriptional regulator [Nitratireductor sp. XY-223]|uniref:Fur family transcriptional regulator n=1 Tax=Nitratireductor sp. XY-223 TaxID=2561926 RepID=UPI0010AA1F4F|nr:Fur family transcriptional regulator [Nitratireductor sp. XY-223]
MSAHIHAEQPALTKNQSLVYDALTRSKAPLSAYAILDGVREHGIRAPLQVYRALDKLLEMGLVHRLESLNSFVACSNSECEARETIVFAICEKCSKVSELADDRLEAQLNALASADHFSVHAATVELRGFCKQCRPTG